MAAFLVLLMVITVIISVWYFYYQPIEPVKWQLDVKDNVGQVLENGSSIYVANYSNQINNYNGPGPFFAFSVYKFNANNGKLDWVTNPVLFTGLGAMFYQNYSTLGAQIWLMNGKVFLGDGSAPGAFYSSNYTIYSFNSTTGKQIGSQVINFNHGTTNQSVSVFGGQFIPSDKGLFFTFISMTGNRTSLYHTTYNSSLHTYGFRLKNDTYDQFLNISTSVPNTNGFGTGYTKYIISDNTEVCKLQWFNSTILVNLHTGNISKIGVNSGDISFTNSNIFLSETNNSSLSVYKINSSSGTVHFWFQYNNSIFNTTNDFKSLSINALPGGYLVVNAERSVLINLTTYNPITSAFVFGFNPKGGLIWHFNYTVFPYDSQINYAGNNEIFFSVYNPQIDTPFSQEAYFNLINFTDGHVLWHHNYYSTGSRYGRSYSAPQYFLGTISVFNQNALIKVGDNVELAKLPG